jgi:hypothetical protein
MGTFRGERVAVKVLKLERRQAPPAQGPQQAPSPLQTQEPGVAFSLGSWQTSCLAASIDLNDAFTAEGGRAAAGWQAPGAAGWAAGADAGAGPAAGADVDSLPHSKTTWRAVRRPYAGAGAAAGGEQGHPPGGGPGRCRAGGGEGDEQHAAQELAQEVEVGGGWAAVGMPFCAPRSRDAAGWLR